jgi:hypothetical protein
MTKLRQTAAVFCLAALAGCGLSHPQPMSGGHYSDPYDNCVANMAVLGGDVTAPHVVLGTIQGSGTVLTSFGRETAVRNAIWDACQKYPNGDAIINFEGDSQGKSVYYSGVVIQWKR